MRKRQCAHDCVCALVVRFLAGRSNGDHPPLWRTGVASVVALAQGVVRALFEFRAISIPGMSVAITLATACI